MKRAGRIQSFFKAFGKNPSKEQIKHFTASPNYYHGRFQNNEPIKKQRVPFREIWRIVANRSIPVRIPSQKTDLKSLDPGSTGIVWFGHSTCLIHYKNYNILVDPVLRKGISPLPNYIKAYRGTAVYQAQDLPAIDLLILTHDHFDHMEYNSLADIKPIVGHVIVPLGVSAHLESWGYPKQRITEMDWYDEEMISDELCIAATPARHFSGRNLFQNRTLWASFVLKCGERRIFISGDGGYGKHFKSIGEKYGPFDLALLENGQYSPYWRNHHSFPFEIPEIMKDLHAKMLFPVHWSKFSLSSHDWMEPIADLLAAKPDFSITIPQIGEFYNLDDPGKKDPWWENLE